MPELTSQLSSKPSASTTLRLPELLAPAGDWDCARAAVENGADAIYFGLDKFNARMRAHNFTEADLPELMKFLHSRGVRGYVTFNTLIFTHELTSAEQYLRQIIAAGVDAAIVQDVGICQLIRKLSPDFPIHASTQMTVTSAAGVAFAKELGCQLVVLARECSLKELEAIQIEQKASGTTALPLEVFVHGALCVAYSGQCLTSESLGGRSANRGECAQACRMPYELISDGQIVDLGDRKYLLSPQDLAGLEVIPDLIRTGMTSLKIEGRLKTPEYVANITRVYRQAIDRVGASLQENKNSSEVIAALNKENRYDLEMGFSRGLYTGWFRGINNQELAHARFGKKRGFYLGEVTRVGRDSVFARLQGPAALGDGIVFDAGQPDQPEEGGRIYGLRNSGAEVELAFGHDSLDFTRIHRGDKIWKTNDPQLDKKIRLTYTGEKPNHQRDVSVEAHGSLNKPLSLLMQDTEGNVVHADSTILLQAAENRPITQESLMAQMGRLGGTEFKLKELKNFVEGQVMIPMSELNQLRRTLVEKLRVLRAEPKKWHLNGPEASWRGLFPVKAVEEKSTPELHILVRNLEQLETVLQLGTKTIYCEFEDPKKYREAVTMARLAFGCQSDRSIFVAPPRITKPGEEWILKQVRSAGADGYLVRNYDHLQYFKDERCVGDFSLNVANPITAKYYMDHFRLERLTASYDLNVDQLEGLLANCPGNWLEVTLHQHMPMFHMEHCVFCAFLSSGTDFKNCGRPCDTHKVSIKDRVGAEHPLKADAGCRNTVYNSRAQTGAEFWNDMQRFGVYQFRIEFLNETPAEVTQTITQYRKLLRGEIDGRQVWSELKLINQLGVTRGQMAGFKK